MTIRKFFYFPLVLILANCTPQEETLTAFEYPITKTVDTVDTYFGVDVPDPYRWLEDDRSSQTADWVTAQNKVTFTHLEDIPFRNKIKNRLEKLFNYERVYAPVKHGNWEYFYRNDGLQNQNVLYRQSVGTEDEEVFLDPNTFKEDGTISMAGTSFTKDGSLVGYLISEGGSDWRKAIVMNTETKEIVGDTLIDIKFSRISWNGNDGFYYSSYDKPDGSELSQKTQQHKLYYHKIGTPQEEDQLIFGGDMIRRYVGASVTEDERFLVIEAATSTSGNELYIKDLNQPESKLVTIVDNFDSNNGVVDNVGSTLFIETNLDAPNNRLVTVEFDNPAPENWKDLIPENDNVLEISTGGGKLFAHYLVDAKT
ncbi:MAG: S9 family peptidase, partial [Cyclobacteriaceae bacterium]